MGTELTVLNNQTTAIQVGGLGIDWSNKLFQLKPATLTIVQPNSQVEGAIKGSLRIAETGDQFQEMWGTLLAMPTEQRQYHIGEAGGLNRTPENLMCFSTDMVHPNDKARVPQAVNCASCPRQDWTAWREYKEHNDGRTNKALIPACDASYSVVLVDSQYKLPLRMYLRSKAKEPFEQGMNNLARIIAMAKSQGNSPNIFDVKFRITTKMITTGKFVSYIPIFDKFSFVTEEEREQFGSIYLNFVASKQKREQETAVAEAEAEVSTSQASIDSEVAEGEYIATDGEITI